MKKRNKIIIALTCILLLGLIILGYFSYPYVRDLNIQTLPKSYNENSLSNNVLNFLDKKLSRDDFGVYTNYVDEENKGDLTKGHYILSESQGLLMEYAVMTNNQDLFNKAYSVVDDYMMLDNGLVGWRISKDNNINKTSALIDDVRIAKSLINGYLKFDKFKYKVDGIKLSESILENSTYNNMVIDFNDSGNLSKTITLCYLDLEGFKLLSHINEKWNDIYLKSNDILAKGYISDDFPLFKKSYNVETSVYSNEKENELLLSLMIWENILKEGGDPDKINKWMKDQMQKYGCLYTKYSVETNEPLEYVESTSIYAIAYRVSLYGDDKKLQDKLYSSLMKYYVKEGTLKGGFGFEKTKSAYSFDNLEGMISLIVK